MIEDGSLQKMRDERYAGWDGDLGSAILGGSMSLAELERRVGDGEISPVRRSGHQEMLENVVNRAVWSAGRPPTG